MRIRELDRELHNGWLALLLAAGLVLGGAGAAVALADGADRHARHDPMQRLTRGLDLSPEQQQDIAALLESHRQWRRENLVDADGRATPEAGRRAREAREALHAEIRLRLTAEQQQTLQQQMRPPRRGGASRGRGAMPLSGLRSLDLSEEQVAAIRELMREHRQAAPAERGAGGRADRRERHEALREAVLATLTPEQAERWRETARERGGMPRRHGRPPRGAWRSGGEDNG